jgi:hypothetical protein
VSAKEEFMRQYKDHLETWGPHCGAPKSVFKGHLDKLLRTNVSATEERLKAADYPLKPAATQGPTE